MKQHRNLASRHLRLCGLMAAIAVALLFVPSADTTEPLAGVSLDRSPVDVILTADEQFLLTANQTTGTVSLVRTDTGKVMAEVPAGKRPSALALSPNGTKVLATATWSGELFAFDRQGETMKPAGSLWLGFEPRGVAISPDGNLAYVALTTAHVVAVVDLKSLQVAARIPVGHWPRYLTLSPDGERLAVGANGDGGVTVVDTVARKELFTDTFAGLNLGQMHASRDGKFAYFPWIVYRRNPITPTNVRQGWVMGSRIARVRLDEPAHSEAISLDPQGEAVSDPHGLALSPDEQWMACAASGTHELLVYQLADLPFQDDGGPEDHIDPKLLVDQKRFYRIPLGGRPMAVRFAKDGRRVFVANYLSNAVQVVDIVDRKVIQTIALGSAKESSLERTGEAIFFDGRRSTDQWYSCHSCHYEGHTNAVTMDTKNDGRFGNFKTVLSLRSVGDTAPYFWHGWQADLKTAVKKSMMDTMLGPEPKDHDVEALAAYMKTLRPPPNPNRGPNGKFSDAAVRGEKVFRGEIAACARCHSGAYFTDGRIHDVKTGEPGDVFKGYNPPSLIGVFDRMKYLHDGRSASLEDLLRGPHNPAKVTGNGELNESELADLLAYLREL